MNMPSTGFDVEVVHKLIKLKEGPASFSPSEQNVLLASLACYDSQSKCGYHCFVNCREVYMCELLTVISNS
jgi:hypothetical protein